MEHDAATALGHSYGGFFGNSLKLMGLGMLGILVVMALIMGIIAVLNAVTKPKEKDDRSSSQ